jgi:hypothetical protein
MTWVMTAARGVPMTTTSQATSQSTSPAEMHAIERMYDDAMASIADMTARFAKPDVSEPWPATEEIDIASIQPPVPTRRSVPEPHPTSAPAPRRPWLRWLSFGSPGVAAAR